MKLLFIEAIVITIVLFIAISWYQNPEGVYEPQIVIGTTILFIIEFIRRFKLPKDTAIVELVSTKIEVKENDVVDNTASPVFNYSNSGSFFAERFALAFPGVRSKKTYTEGEAIDALSILLKKPILFSDMGPIWWFGYGNNAINSFEDLGNGLVLINHMEFNLNKLVAVYHPTYKKHFLYVEVKAMPSTGVYETSKDSIERDRLSRGFAYEEYGLYKGQHMFDRAHYDDNATIIMGKNVPLNGDAEVRTRFLTPYNFVICSHDNPINNSRYDMRLRSHLKNILNDEDSIDNLISDVDKMPLRD